MKNIFSVNHSTTRINAILLFLRVAIAALMLSHGIPKFTALLSGVIQFPPVFGLSAELSLGLAVFAEVFCSLFILLGLGTRLATIPLIITMLVAVLYIHAADPFSNKEIGILFLLSYITLFITGSGKYSIDYLIHRKKINLSAVL